MNRTTSLLTWAGPAAFAALVLAACAVSPNDQGTEETTPLGEVAEGANCTTVATWQYNYNCNSDYYPACGSYYALERETYDKGGSTGYFIWCQNRTFPNYDCTETTSRIGCTPQCAGTAVSGNNNCGYGSPASEADCKDKYSNTSPKWQCSWEEVGGDNGCFGGAECY